LIVPATIRWLRIVNLESVMKFRLLVCSLILSVSPAAIADAPKPGGYYLSVDEGGPGSGELMRGDFDAAIVAAQHAVRTGHGLSAYLTLCAAYIRTNALDSARTACDSAVSLAGEPITTMRNPHGHTNRDGLAKAHLNRGVLFTALGEVAAARTDFEVARRQDREPEVVGHNLALNASLMSAARQD
jgi:Flp pilus assembly protein TadD